MSAKPRVEKDSVAMDKTDELRQILRDLPGIYRSGDVAGYLENYATDMTSYFEGVVSNYDEACDFIWSLEDGGKSLEFTTGDRSHVLFSEDGNAATLCYPWREKFRFADGRVTDTEFYQTEVWFWRAGQWKRVHVHLSVVKEHSAPA
jgi:ketosteroid isomerase-like protein